MCLGQKLGIAKVTSRKSCSQIPVLEFDNFVEIFLAENLSKCHDLTIHEEANFKILKSKHLQYNPAAVRSISEVAHSNDVTLCKESLVELKNSSFEADHQKL